MGQRAVGHAVEPDLGDGQHPLADEADVELPAGHVLLDQHLLELLEHLSATRFLSARLEVQTAPLSMPTLASSAEGLTMAGRGNSAGVLLACARVKAGTGSPAADKQRVGDVLPVADGGGPGAAAGERHAGQLERADDEVLELGVAVDPLAEIEDQVGPADPAEPAEVAQADRQQLDLVAPAPEDVADLVDVAHDRGHVLRAPLVAAGIVEDRHLHHATSARSERPLIRRHAMSATVRISSS